MKKEVPDLKIERRPYSATSTLHHNAHLKREESPDAKDLNGEGWPVK